MGVESTAKPNETAQELEQQRKQSIKNAFGNSKTEEKNKNDEISEDNTKEKVDNPEEKLDNENNNSYINDEKPEKESGQDKPSQDDSVDEYEKVLNDTFGGDPKKAVKSWKESQKNYTKLRQESKEAQQKIETLDNLLKKNPKVDEILSLALDKGEITDDDLQNFLRGDREPQGKPTDTSPDKSKLEIVDDVDNIDEQKLADEGLLDLSNKKLLNSTEWEQLRRQAALKYAQKNLPKQVAQQAYTELKQQIDENKRQEEQKKEAQKNQQVNSERYQKGIERVVEELNIDFAGNPEHGEMLDEIETLAANIRDPKNKNVIHPNAIYLATLEVAKEKGIQTSPATNTNKQAEEAKQQAEEALEDKMGFNKAGNSTPTQSQPQTIGEKLRQRRLESYNKELAWRKETQRIGSGD